MLRPGARSTASLLSLTTPNIPSQITCAMKDLIQHESIHNDGTVHWLTPPNILKALGDFDLDPCAAPEPRPWRTAEIMWSPPKDGLEPEWFGRVWLNPPYGNTKVFTQFMVKMAYHQSGIALVFARTDAKWFCDITFPVCTACLFLSPRVSFYQPDGTVYPNKSGAPSVLIAYSKKDATQLHAACQDYGLKGSFFQKTTSKS